MLCPKNYLMPQNTQKIAIAEEAVISKIYLIRGQKVMLDRDLAELYGVETKTLKQAVRRNLSRFPLDFMFEMTGEELDNWRSQFVTSKQDRQGLRYAPFCFTEQGATMLSCLLNSERAISVNILIIRVFTKLREMVLTAPVLKASLFSTDSLKRSCIARPRPIVYNIKMP